MKRGFSLQRILELKERREQATAMQLAQARQAAEVARHQTEALEALRQGGELQRGNAGLLATVGQLQNAAYVRDCLDQQIAESLTAMREAESKVNVCFAEFTLATRERQMLDRLKERQKLAAQAAEVDADRKTMDAIALSRYVRQDKSTEGSDG